MNRHEPVLSQYELEIHAYIPDAAAIADKQVPATKTDSSKAAWNRIFHREMDRMTEKAGIRKIRPDK